ncbi:VanZ family protein [Noviherbaspirillum massiliense]|uniref:VanZ family protein n=1 Tax=Noviherbaspirillum massiliense TaxID=1465823 RepID=UPI0002E559E0|nr:VanZ family protein [Noviherbaspirillum massiliense]
MTEPPANPRADASVFARVGLLMYILLIVYASWYPFSGWHNMGLQPWSFLFAPLPHYWTVFDAVTNVIAYFPFGMLMVFALYPRLRGLAAGALAILAGILLSGVMEAVQTFLPSRVSSNLDLITNAAGSSLGALAGMLLTRGFLQQGRLVQLRQQWFSQEASRGLIVVGLWPLAQIYPQAYLFGHGQVLPILSDWLTQWMEEPFDLAAMLTSDLKLTAQEYWLSETIITASGLTGAALTLLCMMRRQAPRARLMLLMIAAAFAVKSMANALAFSPDSAFVWLTPGAKGGLLVGAMMLSGLAFTGQAVQRRVAALMLTISVVVANLVPINPYFVATLQTWIQGKFLNFNGAAQFLSLFWPFLALWFLSHPTHRLMKK